MDSFFAKNRLSAYLDGTLSEQEAGELASAIERDPELRAEYESLRAAVDQLRRYGSMEAPAGFHARVMDAIRKEPAPGGAISRLRRLLHNTPVEALALAAAAVVVVIVIQGRPDALPRANVAAREVPSLSEAIQNSGLDFRPDPAAEAEPTAAAEPTPEVVAAVTAPAAPAPKPAKAKTVTRAKKPQVPDEPFVADWEQPAGQTSTALTGAKQATDGVQLLGTRGYRVTLSDAQILTRLASMARASNGRLLDKNGQTLRPHALTIEKAFAIAVLIVPRQSAADIEAALSKLGANRASPPMNAPELAEDEVGFWIEVSHLP